jgi:hypothetical protein
MFGDVIKVTPTSKVVGDMALLMVTSGLTRAAVLDPDTEIAFPESVVQLFRGDLGQPYGGFPPELQRKVLQGAAPRTCGRAWTCRRPIWRRLRPRPARRSERAVTDRQFASYLMYPKVFTEYAADRRRYSDVAILPTRCSSTAWSPDRKSGRAGARQDADRALRHPQRTARGRHAHGVLRTQRPAALGARHRSQPEAQAAAAAQDRCRAIRATSARRCRAPSPR